MRFVGSKLSQSFDGNAVICSLHRTELILVFIPVGKLLSIDSVNIVCVISVLWTLWRILRLDACRGIYGIYFGKPARPCHNHLLWEVVYEDRSILWFIPKFEENFWNHFTPLNFSVVTGRTGKVKFIKLLDYIIYDFEDVTYILSPNITF